MSTLPDARHSRWLQGNSHGYHNIAGESVADDHEMIDFNMLSPPVLDPDAVSLQSCSTPLVRLADPKADAVNDGSLGEFREEEHRKPR